MARSYTHRIGGHYRTARAGEMRLWKRQQQRRLRREVRVRLGLCDGSEGPVLPLLRGLSDIWASPGDGRPKWGGTPGKRRK